MKLREALKTESIQNLRLASPFCVERNESLERVIRGMQDRKTGCAIILDGKKLSGIFTERDAMTRVAFKNPSLSSPISNFMTPNPKSLKVSASIAEAIRLMNKGGYRRIPLVNEEGDVVGVLSVRIIVRYLAEHFPYEIYNLPPDPQQINRAREGA